MARKIFKEGDWVKRIHFNDYYVISNIHTAHRWYSLTMVICDNKPFKAIYNRNVSYGELKKFYELADAAKVLYEK
jgi:hypothetical protein